MNVRHYKSFVYKLAAAASHIGDSGVWPYYTERLKRRVTRSTSIAYSSGESEAIYGPHIHDLREALRAIGLPEPISDPRVQHQELFERANRRIQNLDIPFQQLGIAGACDLNLIYSIATGVGANRILETGVALGWSSLVFLAVAERTNGKLVSVDLPYPFLIGNSWVGVAVPEELKNRWTLLRGSDRTGIPAALRLSENYDLIHYDSDKSVQGRQWAYPQLWDALQPGGILISDDIGDNGAWWNFCNDMGIPLIVVRRQRALSGLARKPWTAEAVRLRA